MGHNSIWLVSQRLLQHEHLKGRSWRHSKREVIFKQKMISGETTLATNWEMLIFLWSKLLSLCHFATENHTSWFKSSGDCLRPSSHFLTFADLDRGHKGCKICCRGSSTLTHSPPSSNTIFLCVVFLENILSWCLWLLKNSKCLGWTYEHTMALMWPGYLYSLVFCHFSVSH